MNQVRATIAHRRFALDSDQIERALGSVLPEPLDDHYVVIAGRRFPPKQVIGLVTGLDRADFNTHQARQVLSRLGFTVGRRAQVSPQHSLRSPERISAAPGPSGAEALRPYAGQWVAQRGDQVLVAAASPQAVLGWLERYNQTADAMFRVPRDEREASGLAPT